MIGGYDEIFIKTHHGYYIEFISKQLKSLWPNMIIQDANSSEIFENIQLLPFYQLNEIFLYKDSESYSSWLELGADESNQNTMIHIIEDDQTVTLVFDDPNHEVAYQIVQFVTSFNQEPRHKAVNGQVMLKQAYQLDQQVDLQSNSESFIQFLAERAKEPATISFEELEKELELATY